MTSRVVGRILAAGLIASRLAEARFAKRNEAAARACGAVEHGAGHYPAFFVLHPAWLAGIIAESSRSHSRPRVRWLIVGALATPLRWATMRSLGDQWTTRIMITPGRAAVRTGLYRLTPHPAYAAVTLELLALPLGVRAPRTATVASIANAVLLGLVRIPAEHRAELTRTPPRG